MSAIRKTAIFKDDLFLEHDPGPGHPECPARLAAIYQQLDQPETHQNFLFPAFVEASSEVLALNHTAAHIKRAAATAGKVFETLDPDTHTSPRSYEAACLAAGAVVKATEMIVSGEADNAFALVRPPGHHAEADRTSGFCIFNNIAIAAHYGLAKLNLEKILIVDWDLHHGNGTQHAFYNTNQVLYISTHQYPYFPGTGSLSETGAGQGEGFNINIPLQGGQDDRAFARIFNELITPVTRQYKPELIMVSAGFDIYHADPLGTMGVTAEGFGYMTKVLRDLAAEICDGRLILVLEGGYNLEGLKDGILKCLAELAGRNGLKPETINLLQNSSVPLTALEGATEAAKNYWTF